VSYLLDTHTFLWYIDGSTELSDIAKNTIQNSSVDKFISIASLWEISIKINLNKLTLSLNFDTLPQFIQNNKFNDLVIKFNHLQQLSSLPHHHGDPFDRLLISQAIAEDLTIISADQHFKAYPVNVLW